MIKNNQLCKRILMVVSVFLVACSTAHGPVVIRDVGQQPVVVSAKKTQTHTTSVSPEQKISPTIVSPITSVNRLSSSVPPLQQQLLQQSQKKLDNNNVNEAIVLAERGLRIDRKEPKFYAVLAQAYYMLGDKNQSVDFARQGLRYATPDSDDYQKLLSWLP